MVVQVPSWKWRVVGRRFAAMCLTNSSQSHVKFGRDFSIFFSKFMKVRVFAIPVPLWHSMYWCEGGETLLMSLETPFLPATGIPVIRCHWKWYHIGLLVLVVSSQNWHNLWHSRNIWGQLTSSGWQPGPQLTHARHFHSSAVTGRSLLFPCWHFFLNLKHIQRSFAGWRRHLSLHCRAPPYWK